VQLTNGKEEDQPHDRFWVCTGNYRKEKLKGSHKKRNPRNDEMNIE